LWLNDVLQKSTVVHTGSIFALSMEEKWLFTGGWDKTIKVQEIQADDFEIEARPVGSIASNSVITALLYTQGFLLLAVPTSQSRYIITDPDQKKLQLGDFILR
ncbi:hypothetical protein Dimus_005297, partial [Dionaea muscipula]